MAFLELLLINMAMASGIAGVGDVATQHLEMCLKRKPGEAKKKKKVGEGEEGEEEESSSSSEGTPVQASSICMPGKPAVWAPGDYVIITEDVVLEDGSQLDEGDLATIVTVYSKHSGFTSPHPAGYAVAVRWKDLLVDLYEGEFRRDVQVYDPIRTLRMMAVAGLVFDPMSFTWYYAVLPKLVPGHAGALSVGQLARKIAWDTVVYGGVVTCASVTANAVLQKPNCAHVAKRVKSDVPILYFAAIALSIPADVPVFILVPAKWQAASFKVMDACFMLVVSYVVNRRLDNGKKPTPALRKEAATP